MDKRVIIQINNHYSQAFPERKIISRNTLHLIKILRSNGIEVVVEGQDGVELEYFTEKGFRKFISDPVNVFLVGIPLNIFLGILNAGLYDQVKGQESNGVVSEKLIIHEDKNGATVTYSENGLPLSAEKMKEIIDEASKKRIVQNPSPISPDPSQYPCPVYLEHTSKIVGWCYPYEENNELHVKSKFTDDETWGKIRKGELKGFSIGGIVTNSKCSICGEQYIKCNHITGQKYNGKKCINNIIAPTLCDISIVSDPVNTNCLINLGEF